MAIKTGRVIFLIIILLIFSSIFTFRLIKLQLVDGKTYANESKNSVVTKTIIKAPRGDILDRYCRPIVQSRMAITVEFNKTLIKDLNNTIFKTINIFEKCGQTYIDTFPISKTEPFVYDEAFLSSEGLISKYNKYLSDKRIKINQTADKDIEALIKYYKLGSFNIIDARKIIAVLFEMELRSIQSFFTFANDINIETATAVKENSDELQGVYLEVEPVRYYTENYFASHIIGQVGRIYASEYESLQEKGYMLDDFVGKDGIEKIAEDYLKGENGYKYAQRDITGNTLDIIENVDPKPGNDVILTIDKNMQIITEEALPEIIRLLKEQNGEEAANSASAVFMDIHTGEVLSMGSYPTYNIATYNEDFRELSQDPSKPFVNRAISGLFPPGSTFKIVAAAAGLEEGFITDKTTYNCTGIYTYYKTYQPQCFNSTAHGKETVKEALQKSCNTFFFDLSRKMGIDLLNKYGKLFGFGEKTGIELQGESKGILAGRENRELSGGIWQDGETLMAAIGQTDNTVTPLQLANYISTVANGGTRYEPHIIKTVRNRESGKVIYETLPVVKNQLDLQPETLESIIKGLSMATEEGGSAYSGFKDFKTVKVAIKTGTSEMSTGIASALMVGFAPADNPQIAFSVVVENGGTGAASILSVLIKDVLSYYFSNRNEFDKIQSDGDLLT
ncbi:MAG: Penicillin-binding protein 2 [Clostridia bacterium]|nr:Penicillin-binding protein 2 [Clostridia bacterium]